MLSLCSTSGRTADYRFNQTYISKMLVIYSVVGLLILFMFFLRPCEAFTVETPAQIEDYIVYKAQREGVSVGMAVAIAKAESSFIPNARNPVGTASGIFQFLDSTFRNYCINKYHIANSMEQKNHPALQVNCAIEMLAEPLGYMHWMASFASWGFKLQI